MYDAFMLQRPSRMASKRRGLTLVEVILVLTLLVIVGAVSVPMLGGSFSRAGLQSAADLLRAAWSKGRLAAMQSGQSYVFRFEPNGGRYQLLAFEQLDLPESEQLPPDNQDPEHSEADILRLSLNRMPDGIVFAQGDVADSSEIAATYGSAAGGTWSSPILFRADGTTSDASIVLKNESGQTIRVTLRGLTGISNAGDVVMEAAR
jgi:type II secretory pathway pseudopilin PulG